MLFEDLMDTNPDRAPTAGEFLDPMAAARGFRTTHGQPDRSRAARLAIKDFISGKLLHVHEPPGFENKKGLIRHFFFNFFYIFFRIPREHT